MSELPRRERKPIPEGARVRFIHRRHYTGMDGTYFSHEQFPGQKPNQKGGTTICYIERPTGEVVDGKPTYEVLARGLAHCSLKDQFVKRYGRNISQFRAQQNLK